MSDWQQLVRYGSRCEYSRNFKVIFPLRYTGNIAEMYQNTSTIYNVAIDKKSEESCSVTCLTVFIVFYCFYRLLLFYRTTSL